VPTGNWNIYADGINPSVFQVYGSELDTSASSGTLNDVVSNLGVKRFSSGSAKTVTGFVAPSPVCAQILHVINLGGNLTLSNESTASVAANRIITGTGANVTVTSDGGATLVYDQTTARWRIIGSQL
jgi:hypothetical protein